VSREKNIVREIEIDTLFCVHGDWPKLIGTLSRNLLPRQDRQFLGKPFILARYKWIAFASCDYF